MKMSQLKQVALYGAIHDGIMDTRIALAKDGLPSKHDALIAQTETAIWRKIQKVLKLETTP